MRGYKDNIVVATHILAQAGRLAPVAERRLNTFVTSVSKAYLKSKDTRLGDIVLFCDAVGKANFVAILDMLAAKEAVDLLRRMDPSSAGEAKANPAWARARLVAVLTGEEPPKFSEASKLKTRIRGRSKAKPHGRRSVLSETDAFSARRRERTDAII